MVSETKYFKEKGYPMKKRRTSIFTEWIDHVGVRPLAKRLGVKESAVHHWKRGLCWPRVKQMQEIRRLSKGTVTYDHIIDGGVVR